MMPCQTLIIVNPSSKLFQELGTMLGFIILEFLNLHTSVHTHTVD